MGGTFQSASPPTTGRTVEELSSLVVVIQVKTVESNSDNVWARKPGGKVVMVEVCEGGVYVELDDVDNSGAYEDVASEVESETVGLRQS